MNRLLIIDGHNLHFQIFFGIRSKQKKRPGYPVKFGESFTGSLKRIIRVASPTHVVVVFDGEHENPRRALFPAYKANRPDYDLLPDEENPYLQLPAAFEALEKLGVKYIETTRLEADDLIALCAERFKSAAQVIVCSHDHDFYQLICPQVKIMNYSGKQGTYYGEAAFRDEFHISPRRFADYKALTGDKSDNIPGVRGVGSITAARLLNRFGGVEDIIAHTGEVRQKKLRRCLVEGVDRMRLNYKLVKLGGEQYGEVELPWKLSELEFSLPEEKKRGRGRGAKSQTTSVGQNEQTVQNPKNPRGVSAANSPKGPDNAKNTKNPGNQKNIRDPQKEQAAKSAAPDEVISAPGKTPDQPRKPRNQRRCRSSKRNQAQNQTTQNQIEQNQTAQNQAVQTQSAQPQTAQNTAQGQTRPPKQPSKSSKKKQNQPKKQADKASEPKQNQPSKQADKNPEQKQNQPPKQADKNPEQKQDQPKKQTAKAPEQKQDQPQKPKQNQQKNRQTKPNERQKQSPEQNQNDAAKQNQPSRQNQPRKPGYDRKKPRRDDFALDFDSNEPIGNRIQTRKPMWLGGDAEPSRRG